LKGKIFQALLILALVVAVAGFAGCVKAQEEVPPSESSMPPEFLLDSDDDGFSDWFEENVADYDPSIPNDRYFIYCHYTPEIEKELNIEFNLIWRILVEENRVSPQYITRLTGEDATRSNLQKAIEEIALKADENDIVLVNLGGHGEYDNITCCYDGNILYSDVNEWLDEIRAKVVIIQVIACKSECAALILKDGPCPRIVLTGGFSMEGFYNEETADKYPWLPTYSDYGYDNPAPAIDYNDVFFGFADKIGGNGDGYVSLGEFIEVLEKDVEARWNKEEWRNITDYPWWDVARDEYDIANRIYLLEHSQKENIFWRAFHS
jgi:hypothetical protein